jgi:hypothetical protein
VVVRILNELRRHQIQAQWHEGTDRGAWHQRQADRIVDRLGKCERRPVEVRLFTDVVEAARTWQARTWRKSVLFSNDLTLEQRRAILSADDDGRTAYFMARGGGVNAPSD